MERFLRWLIRPQFNALVVAVAFLIGNLPFFRLPWWGGVLASAVIGVTFGSLSWLIPWHLRRRACDHTSS